MKPRWWLHYYSFKRGDVQVPFTTYEAAAEYVAMCEREGYTIVSLTCEDPIEGMRKRHSRIVSFEVRNDGEES